jgi:hypothetical protein
MITHTVAAVVTRHCGDITVVGSAAATFSVGGSRPKVSAWSAGGNLTQFDADAYALARTAEEIAHTYTDEVPPPDNIFIISNLASALQAVKNPRSVKAHSSALRFHRALTTFTLCHSHVAFYLVWSPADGDLEGFRMASVTNLQGPPSERTPEEKLWDFKTRAQQYARDRESCDDTRISYLEFLETEAEDDLALARMIAG